MKIAVATDGLVVAAHFGRCPEYTIVTVDDNGKATNKVVIPNPGHEPGFLPEYLSKLGVSCIIAGGMGPRAQGLFTERNIQTVTGVSGLVNEVVDTYLAGSLEAGESLCEHGNRSQACDRHDKHHEHHDGAHGHEENRGEHSR
ncbi:MAG: NifB/NifX family molybdenum-iron cluster-binding protein [Clostridia bacterium]